MILVPYFQAITAAINTGDTYSFYYGERAWQNLVADDTTFPVVFVDFIPKVTFKIETGGHLSEVYPVTIFIGFKSELDWTTTQHEVEIEKANNATRNFLNQLTNYKDSNGNKIIDSMEIVSADRVILRPSEDCGTSGIMLRLNVKPALNLSVCTN